MSNALIQHFVSIREQTLSLSRPLSEADMTVQAADFVSPGSWHLAHTTWFFEEFFLCILNKHWPQSEPYRFLFNSYYETVGRRQAQGRRGLITGRACPKSSDTVRPSIRRFRKPWTRASARNCRTSSNWAFIMNNSIRNCF